ncbi:MAG TPA: RNA polymerase sigma factor [Tepidisphaeraceae bacterium]|nr:RNA polymerase sigma factor [Tepidisphaeraceae bacterium]
MTDLDLLRRYVADGSPEPFEAVVRTHAGWVYAASLRQVRDTALAEDVTQSVFVLLARRAAELVEREPADAGVVSGWLFKTVRYTALSALRKEGRRRRHEAKAAIAADTLAADSADPAAAPGERAWERLGPHLDEAVASLTESDRQAVLLRFYEGRSFAEIAQAIGTTEPTARQRVSRAVRRLAAFFGRRGITLPAAALAAILWAGQSNAAPLPAGVCASLTAAASGAGAMSAGAGQIVSVTLLSLRHARRRLAAAIAAAMLIVLCWLAALNWPESLPPDPVGFARLPDDGRPAPLALLDDAADRVDALRPRRTFDLPDHAVHGLARRAWAPPGPAPDPQADARRGRAEQALVWLRDWLDRATAAKPPAPADARPAEADGRAGGADRPWWDWLLPPDDDVPESHGQFAAGGGGGPMGGGGGGGGGGRAPSNPLPPPAARAAADVAAVVVSTHGATVSASSSSGAGSAPAPMLSVHGVFVLSPTGSPLIDPERYRPPTTRTPRSPVGSTTLTSAIVFQGGGGGGGDDSGINLLLHDGPLARPLLVRVSDVAPLEDLPLAVLFVDEGTDDDAADDHEMVSSVLQRSSRIAGTLRRARGIVLPADHSWLLLPEAWLPPGVAAGGLTPDQLASLLAPLADDLGVADLSALPVAWLDLSDRVTWADLAPPSPPTPTPEPGPAGALGAAAALAALARRRRAGR